MNPNKDGFYLDVQKLEKSIDEVQAMMDKALESALKVARREMVLSMFDLLGRAMRDAPIEYGDLRGSGIVLFGDDQLAHSESDEGENSAKIVKDKPIKLSMFNFTNYLKDITGTVAFNKEYATEQHEGMQFEHPKGGKAKYLEDNVKKMNKKYAKNYANALKKALNNQGR